MCEHMAGQPFQRREALGCLAVLGSINDRSLLIHVLHPLLGEGRPDDIAGQVFYGGIVIRRNTVSAEDVKAGMPPCGEHGDHLLCNLPLGKKHPEHLVPEDGLQLFQLQGRGDTEHALVAVETAVRHQNVGVRIKSEEIAEGLHGDDGAGDGIIFGDRLLEKDLQGFPGTAAEITALALSPKSPSRSSFKHAVSFIRCGCLARCSTAKCSKNSNDSSNKASTAAGKLPANCQRKQAGTHFTPYRVRSVSVSFLQNRVHVRRRIAAQNPLAG